MSADGSIVIDTRLNPAGAESGIKELTEKLESAGKKTKETGEAMSTYVSAPLTAVGVGALKMAADIQSSQGKLQAQLGLTSEEAKRLGQVAKDVWTDGFGENIDEVSNAVTKVRQNMGEMDDGTLQTMTEAASTLSQVFDADINDTTKTASSLMKNFGISGQDAMDLITTGFQQGGDYSGELLDTLNEYSTQFASMGLSAQDFLGILISGAKNGAFNLDKVGDAVKEFNIRAQDGSTTTAQGFQMIGLNAKQMGEAISKGGDDGKKAFEATIAGLAAMKDPMQQNIAGTSLFGTQWEDVRKKVILSMQQGMTSVKDFKGATQNAADAVQQSFGAQLQMVIRGIGSSLQPLGEILLKMATDALPVISRSIQSLTNWFNQLSPSIKYVVVVVGMIIAAIGPLLVIFGQVMIAITELAPVFAFLISPVGLIIAGIAILVGVLIWLWNTNEGFRQAVISIWNEIMSYIDIALKFIQGIIQQIMPAILSFFSDQLNTLKQFWDRNGNDIKNGVMIAFNAIKGYIQGAMQYIQGVFQIVWPIISGAVQIAWSIIKAVISTTINMVTGIIQTGIAIMKGDWSGAWNSIVGTVQKIVSGITGAFKGLDLGKIGKDIIDGLISGITSMAGGITKAVQSLSKLIPQGLKDFFHISSPSRLIRDEVGKWIPAGLAVGIDQNVDVVTRSANNMAQKAVPTMPQGLMKANINSKQSGNVTGPTLVINPQKAVIDEKDVMNSFNRMVMLYGL
jgi:TP901 family phage tail tape measure protein